MHSDCVRPVASRYGRADDGSVIFDGNARAKAIAVGARERCLHFLLQRPEVADAMEEISGARRLLLVATRADDRPVAGQRDTATEQGVGGSIQSRGQGVLDVPS